MRIKNNTSLTNLSSEEEIDKRRVDKQTVYTEIIRLIENELTIAERNLISLIIMKPLNQFKYENLMQLSTKEYMRNMDIDEFTAFDELKKGLYRLFERSITVELLHRGKEHKLKARLVTCITITEAERTVGLSITDDFARFILKLKKEIPISKKQRPHISKKTPLAFNSVIRRLI